MKSRVYIGGDLFNALQQISFLLPQRVKISEDVVFLKIGCFALFLMNNLIVWFAHCICFKNYILLIQSDTLLVVETF